MAFEIPHDLIHDLQISLRKEAGLSSYNPDDPALPDLPSFDKAISELDPSPAYLRCRHCQARLLRGINSFICVFCGRQHNTELPPDPIKFVSTSACRSFLRSLNLDGSELVGPVVEENGTNNGHNASQNEVPLSEFLDLEIRWPSESEKLDSNVSGKKLRAWNLAGVDLDNFFSESKVDSLALSSEGQFAVGKQNDEVESNAFQGHGNLSLFQNFQPSETISKSEEDEGIGNSSAWEAEFQSTGSGIHHQKSKSLDPFVGSSSIDPSAHMDAVFEPGKDLFGGKTKVENATSSTSDFNDWFEGDIRSNSTTGVTNQAEQLKGPINDKGGGTEGSTNNSSMNITWNQNDYWQATSNSIAPADNKTIDEDFDSFDTWNDFTSSTSVQVPSNNSSTEDVRNKVPSAEKAWEINLFGGTNNAQDVNFGGFVQRDVFSETFNKQNGSAEAGLIVPETSISDGIAGLNAEFGGKAEVEKDHVQSNGDTRSKADDLETIMSQMHDLSFMLESSLSLPQKKDSVGSSSRD